MASARSTPAFRVGHAGPSFWRTRATSDNASSWARYSPSGLSTSVAGSSGDHLA